MKEWFSVSTKGLRQLQEGKPKTFILRELVQNAIDENISACDVSIGKEGRKIKLTITDDSPEGFRDISHAYTLFADTYKRRDPEKRGRFNAGEKDAFSVCDQVKLTTTKGTIIFDNSGRHSSRTKTTKGTTIAVEFMGSQEDMAEMLEYARILLVPNGIRFTVNGEQIAGRKPLKTTNTELSTEYEQDGTFRKTVRKTAVEIHSKVGKAYLYEMGLPVCEIDCQFSINVMQKVPLGMDRETVPQAYLQDVFAEALNMTHELVEPAHASDMWVREATRDERASPEAVDSVIHKRFGEKVCIANQFDPHSIDEALSHGYKVVSGSELSKEEWANIRNAELMKSSSELFGMNSVSAPEVEPTADMRKVAELAKKIAKKILGINISVRFVKHNQMVTAQYDCTRKTVTFNTAKLGSRFFKEPVSAPVLNLIIHEIAHHKGMHTEQAYHECLTKLGAELTMLALRDPLFFESL
jgi:hypothetical protein